MKFVLILNRIKQGGGVLPKFHKVPMSMVRGRGRGRLRIRARGRGRGYLLEQARGLFAPRIARAKQATSRGDYHHQTGPPTANAPGRANFPVARGRNIFPEVSF